MRKIHHPFAPPCAIFYSRVIITEVKLFPCILTRSIRRWNFHLGFIFKSSLLENLCTLISFRLIMEFNYPEDRISKYLCSIESKVSIIPPTDPKLSLSGVIDPKLSNSFLNFQFWSQSSANFSILFCHKSVNSHTIFELFRTNHQVIFWP